MAKKSVGKVKSGAKSQWAKITLKNVDNTYMLVLRIAEGQTLGADGLLYAGCRSNEQINRADEIGKQYFHVFMYHINYAPISLCKFMAFIYFYN